MGRLCLPPRPPAQSQPAHSISSSGTNTFAITTRRTFRSSSQMVWPLALPSRRRRSAIPFVSPASLGKCIPLPSPPLDIVLLPLLTSSTPTSAALSRFLHRKDTGIGACSLMTRPGLCTSNRLPVHDGAEGTRLPGTIGSYSIVRYYPAPARRAESQGKDLEAQQR